MSRRAAACALSFAPQSHKLDVAGRSGKRKRRRRIRRWMIIALGLVAAASACALVWLAPHCRAFAPHQHYVVPGSAMCRQGAR